MTELTTEMLPDSQLASYSHIFGTIWPRLNSKDRTLLLLGFFSAFVTTAATPAFSYAIARLLAVYYMQNNRAAQAKP